MYTQEEKRNTLWSLLQEQSNKKCMDCTAQNPTFACASLGTFICIRCAEFLREFGVHVKSVVSSSFSEEEIKYLLQQGNAVARLKWLARWTPEQFPEPSHDDPNRVRQFMILKYVEKKWANPTVNLVNPITYADSAAAQHPFPASPDTDRAQFSTPQKEGTPKLIDFSPFIQKSSAVQQMQDPNRNPFPIDAKPHNPFVDDTETAPAFTPIMSPPTHPHSPPPANSQDQIPNNPFINPYMNHITPGAPSPNPPQVYQQQQQQQTNPPTNPSVPNPLALSSQMHVHTAHSGNMVPAMQSPTAIGSGQLPQNLNLAALNSPLATPVSSPLVTPSQVGAIHQQMHSGGTSSQPQQSVAASPQSVAGGSHQNHVLPLSRASSSDDTSRMLEEVRTLKQLFEMQMMGQGEYEARRIQLIDSLTKTTHAKDNPQAMEPRLVGTERAIRHRFDAKKNKWCHTATIVIIEQTPFAEGAMRKACRMRDLSQEGQASLMVAKMFRDANEDRASYFKDVEMQMQAKEIADRFNRRNPPKKVDFVTAFVYELVDRPNKQICCAEYYIDGKFEKHNNNFGYINDDERNTPQVFSHFSYEDSNGQLIVVDIQGVGDVYTDPQIHTLDGQGYGRGNLGAEGINKFFSTHACNQICHFYGLTAVNPKQPAIDSGTKPQPKLNQSTNNVDRFNFQGDVFDVFQKQQQQHMTYVPK